MTAVVLVVMQRKIPNSYCCSVDLKILARNWFDFSRSYDSNFFSHLLADLNVDLTNPVCKSAGGGF